MPEYKGKHYDYTPEGYAEYEKAKSGDKPKKSTTIQRRKPPGPKNAGPFTKNRTRRKPKCP